MSIKVKETIYLCLDGSIACLDADAKLFLRYNRVFGLYPISLLSKWIKSFFKLSDLLYVIWLSELSKHLLIQLMILFNVALVLLSKSSDVVLLFSLHFSWLLIKLNKVLSLDLINLQSHCLLLLFMLTLQIQDFLILFLDSVMQFLLDLSIPTTGRLNFFL